MKKIFKFSYFIVILVVSFNCSKEYEVPQDLVVNDFIWKGLNAYYLHQDQVADLSDKRFNSDQELNAFLAGFTDYTQLFSGLLISTDAKSTLIEDYTLLEDVPLRTLTTNGMEFGIISSPENSINVLGYVSHILPDSDASTKDIKRGDFFYAVNGTPLTRDNFLSFLSNSLSNITLEMADFDGTTVIPNTKQVVLESTAYPYPAIYLEKTIGMGGKNIGYLMYNNDFSTNYLIDLNSSFLNFKNQSVTELVLDLRYNIGGGSFAKNIAKIATMITGQFTDDVVLKKEWNTKAQTWFLANQPDSLITKFSTQLNSNTNLNSLGLTDIYLILNGDSFTGSSAVELLINSLKPYINVHLIGNTTSGNNTGSITLYNSEDYNFTLTNQIHTVAIQPIVLRFLNKDDETYESGFAPNIKLCENEDILNLGILGETSDPILNDVLNYISTGITPPISCNSQNFEYIYNSLTPQREIDKGVLIHQDLPNTN